MIFVHTPKCGGSFIGESFGSRFRRCITLREPSLAGHLTWQQYRSGLAALGDDIGRYSVFSVIRNPWDWHLSFYSYIRQDEGGRKSGMPIENKIFEKLSFTDYLRWLGDQEEVRPNQYYLYQTCDWIVDENGKVRIQDILRQENLRVDLEGIRDKYNLRLSIPDRRVNSSKHEDYRAAYDAEGIDIIARRHVRDIELFRYRFDKTKIKSSPTEKVCQP